MKKLIPVISVTVLALVAAGAASAQNFKGFYLGAYAGDSTSRSVESTTTIFAEEGYFASSSVTAVNSVGTFTLFPNGIMGGGRAGWNFRFGHIVFGPELDFGSLRLNSSGSVTAGYPDFAPTTFTINQGFKTRGLFTARARAGAAFGPLLVYVTGGLAVTNLSYKETFTDNFADALETDTLKVDQGGWVVGGGAEFAINRRWSISGEYLYIDFRTATNTSTNLTAFFEDDGEDTAVGVGGSHPHGLPLGEPGFGESFPDSVFTHSASLIERMGRFGINFHF
ncbi:MAG TPA: outer membrane beta-barrel protein [Candidatus Acidoferrum sp.]|nr:outer membrane beta-barrel protein [Candidatus Acidoferrum sp.]